MSFYESSYRIERLYYRYIKGSVVDGKWTAKDMAETLEALGCIKLIEEGQRYVELAKFKPFRERDDFWNGLGCNLIK
jgi:hypothetical protein